MSIIPPLGETSWSRFSADSYVAGEQQALYTGRLHNSPGRTPVLFCHGYQGDPATMQTVQWQPLFNAYAATGHPVLVPELGGQSGWGIPSIVDPGAHIDDTLDYFALPAAGSLRKDKLFVHGLSMGTLNGLGWAWRNPGKVRGGNFVGPIVHFERFYNDNASFQAAIDASWGSHGAWLAGLDNSDPWRNVAKVRPFGHRLKFWYGEDDTLIDPEEVIAYAELVGAQVEGIPGNHLELVQNARVDRMASFALNQLSARSRVYIGWDDRDWDRFTRLFLTNPPADGLNVNDLNTVVKPGGRRGQFTRLSGIDGNERWGFTMPEVSAADMAVKTLWHNGDGGLEVGQHGNMLRAVIDETAHTYRTYMVWSNILFGVPWIVDTGVWTGTLDIDNLTLLGSQQLTIPGLRLAAGGEVLASERHSNVVTLVVHEADADRAYRSGIVDIALGAPLGNYVGPVSRVDETHLQYTAAGADVISGGPGSWADFASCFPYTAESELTDRQVRSRFYPLGMNPPAWDDPDWTFYWSDTGSWGASGYGLGGLMFGHVGIFVPGAEASIQVGPFTVEEL